MNSGEDEELFSAEIVVPEGTIMVSPRIEVKNKHNENERLYSLFLSLLIRSLFLVISFIILSR